MSTQLDSESGSVGPRSHPAVRKCVPTHRVRWKGARQWPAADGGGGYSRPVGSFPAPDVAGLALAEHLTSTTLELLQRS